MECHKCPYYMKGDAAACIPCAARRADIPLNNHGTCAVGLDAIEGTRFEPRVYPQEPGRAEVDEAARSFVGVLAAMPPGAAEALADFLQRLLSLDCRDFRSMADRYRASRSIDARPTLEETGAALGMTKQAAKHRVGTALAVCPELRAMFPKMRQGFTKANLNAARRIRAEIDGNA